MLAGARALFFGGAVLAVACSSSASKEELPRETPSASAKNPDGFVYPTDHLGAVARRGTTRGDRIPNFAFRGYLNGDTSKLQTRSLADFYDPQAKRYRLIHMIAVAYWCSICRGETKEIAPIETKVRADGVVQIAVLISGATNGVGPSLSELDDWHASYAPTYDLAFDVRGTQLSAMGFSGVPWNALIDPRTMELLTSTEGAPVNVANYIQAGVDFVKQADPSYPLPAP